jgi:predicted unusual protein kinase regulating ubiquinone biosynthesis (AarF/ABC1/UbiB family)
MFKQGYKAYQFARVFKAYQSSKNDLEKIKSSKLLMNIMKEQGGLFLKIGQYLGTDAEKFSELEKLSVQKESVLSKELFQNGIIESLGCELAAKFTIDYSWVRSASVGQVHKAQIEINDEKRTAVIKLQYPQIKNEIHSQLKLIDLLPTGVPQKKWGLDINAYKIFFNNLINEELNYQQEIIKQVQANDIFRDFPYMKIPQIYVEFCTDSILVSEFLEGLDVEELKNLNFKTQKSLGEKLVLTYFTMLKNYFLQGDTNHGNFIFDPKGEWVGVIDFGQFVSLEKGSVNSLISLIYKMLRNQSINYFDYIVALGFDMLKIANIKDQLPLLATIIFEPILQNRPYDLNDWQYKVKLEKCLGENKWWFRAAGDQQFFLIMKSFMGIKNLIAKLGLSLNWHQLFLEAFHDNQATYLCLAPPHQNITQDKLCGSGLRVRVLENRNENVRVTLPLTTLFDIKAIIDDDILEKLNRKNINVEEISHKALSQGAYPQILFELEEGHKCYIVEII